MKVLLVGNIANNSYNNAKFLRRKGIEADVLCYNYTHVMGQPEWEDADFDAEVDQFFPEWDKVDLKGFKRPEWFYQENLVPALSKKYMPATILFFLIERFPSLRKHARRNATRLLDLYRKSAFLKRIPRYLRDVVKGFLYHTDAYYGMGNKVRFFNPEREIEGILREQDLIKEFSTFFPWREDNLTRKDLLCYASSLPWFRSIFKRYDIIHACALDPIFAMLATPDKPYVAFEHGTLRDFPFEKSAQGRLLALAYRKAKRVIITNPDTISSAEKLGLDNYVFIPHPIDETKYFPECTPLYNELRRKHRAGHILFCPLRHDWMAKGTDVHIRGFAKYTKKYSKDALLILSLWGQETDRSKRLLRDLGIEKNVTWIYPPNKNKYIQYVNASDIVLDQMIYPHFGAIAPEAMSCGKSVIISFKYEAVRWCFDEPPPLVSAFDEGEVCQKIEELLNDKTQREEIGRRSREWIMKYHSWRLVADRLIGVYEEALGASSGTLHKERILSEGPSLSYRYRG